MKTICKDGRQHNIMSHEFYLVFRFYLRLKISRFETPYKLLYLTFNLFKFKYYAWVSCGAGCNGIAQHQKVILMR